MGAASSTPFIDSSLSNPRLQGFEKQQHCNVWSHCRNPRKRVLSEQCEPDGKANECLSPTGSSTVCTFISPWNTSQQSHCLIFVCICLGNCRIYNNMYFELIFFLLDISVCSGEACWWTIHPASKQRSEGEKVRVGDDLILVSVSSERYLVRLIRFLVT